MVKKNILDNGHEFLNRSIGGSPVSTQAGLFSKAGLTLFSSMAIRFLKTEE